MLMPRPPPRPSLFPYTTLFRSEESAQRGFQSLAMIPLIVDGAPFGVLGLHAAEVGFFNQDRKSTRLNSSHEWISYAVFCLKKKITRTHVTHNQMTGGRGQTRVV